MSKPKKDPTLTKAYTLTHQAHQGKVQALQSLYARYQQEYTFHLFDKWHMFLQGKQSSAISYMGSTKHLPTQLSAALLQGLLKCVTEQLKSYLSGVQSKIRQIIQASSLPADLKHQLHTLNQAHLWTHDLQWIDSDHTCLGQLYWPTPLTLTDDFGQQLTVTPESKWSKPISLSAMRLMRQIAQRVLKKIVLVTPLYPRLLLDSRTCQFSESTQSTHFKHWLSVTTLTKGQRVQLPVHYHTFAQQAGGEFNNSVELLFRDDQLKLVFTQTQAVEEWRNQFVTAHANKLTPDHHLSDATVIAFDMGLCTLLASSEGHLYGQYWLTQLKQYDQKLTSITTQRQKLGITEWGSRQKQIVQQIRGFIKTEVGRILNQWVLTHPHVHTVIIEQLNFQHPALSKKLNRMIQNFGLSRVKAKLKELGVVRGFQVVEVHSAYTSQECRHCGWVSEYNRKTQSQFECELCGKQSHADSGASCTIQKRFLNRAHTIGKSKGQCLLYLRTQFVESLGSKVQQGIVDPHLLAFLLSKGPDQKRGLMKDRASLAVLTDALRKIKPSLVAS